MGRGSALDLEPEEPGSTPGCLSRGPGRHSPCKLGGTTGPLYVHRSVGPRVGVRVGEARSMKVQAEDQRGCTPA